MTPVRTTGVESVRRGAALLLLAGGAALAGETETAQIVARMESFYRASPGITADFVQVSESRTLGRPQEERGTLSLKPPGKMRWEYASPRGKLAVTDGARAYVYLPEDRQVIVGTMSAMDSGGVTARLLIGSQPTEAVPDAASGALATLPLLPALPPLPRPPLLGHPVRVTLLVSLHGADLAIVLRPRPALRERWWG